MKQIAKRLTYANVMSTIAVFLVLGGATAVAANTLGKNSVGTVQLKANAVTAAKLKNGAVTGSKLQNGAVTGSKINLSTLGTVPSATNANHASTADTATNANHASTADNATHASTADNATNAVNATDAVNATNATNFSRYVNSGLVKAALGQTVNVVSIGPFTVIGECSEGSGDPVATVYLTTSSPGSSEVGYEESYPSENFDPGMKAETTYKVTASHPEIGYTYGGYYTGFNAATSDGSMIVSGAVDNGVNFDGAPCVFFGHMVNES